MSILESIILGLLFGATFQLLKITTDHKKRIEKLEEKYEVID